MIVEDEELRNLFKTASEEHLQKLNDGLLHLEKHPEDQARLEELLREAHSLKGDSRMLGVRDVETLTHQLEHILGCVKRGEAQLTAQTCDRLYQGLDAMCKLVHEAVTGEPAGINTFGVLAHMMGADSINPAKQNNHNDRVQEEVEANTVTIATTSEAPPPQIDLEISPAPSPLETLLAPSSPPAPVEAAPLEAEPPRPTPADIKAEETFSKSRTPTVPPPAANEPYRIETIRVETRNLDALLTQAGELTVTKIRIAHRLAEIEEIVALCEEWNRPTLLRTSALNVQKEKLKPERQLNPSTTQHSDIGAYSSASLETKAFGERMGVLVNQLRNAIYEDTTRLDTIASDLEEGIRTLRLLPLSTIFQMLPRMVRDLAKQQNKEIELAIAGDQTKADKRILEEMKDPLIHMIRNCVDHGIETPAEREAVGKPPTATIRVRGYQTATNIVIEVADDGRGLDTAKIKQTALKRGICREEELAAMTTTQIHSLIFAPGFSTRTFVTEVSGRGVGLDVVRTNVERLKGTIQVESTPERGCTLRVQLGINLATVSVLIVEVGGRVYALPVEFVQQTRLVSSDEIFSIQGRETIIQDNHPVSVAQLVDLLELSVVNGKTTDKGQLLCIILQVGEERLGLLVDACIDQQDVILKPQSKLLKRVRNVAGATILGTGEVCMVLNPLDLIKSVQKRTAAMTLTRVFAQEEKRRSILLAEDSIAIRTQEKRILENAGYEVVTAVDGLDAYNKLRTRSFDAVISDVQMPNLDGLGFTAKIRQHQEYNELPIILVTSLASDEDKRRGAEAGANAYITKGNFNQEVLLETLRRFI
ncbi:MULTISPECIES: hybrid sensor histidine kinase/response regulator [Cyanophyceae]|uniref:hybrid sensor histidine kinase/response regulator n=1 Tax=Cyanophyceae TaxID=3028117 RepID=UPI001685859A|nr:hybrid sensor histidine kinase/response regulator [Trichocoleus sp. FACHB-40]MBD2006198.1 hybrid sensor histidine kinase/response regulator [Trichocoleus sp. FACHB-40]